MRCLCDNINACMLVYRAAIFLVALTLLGGCKKEHLPDVKNTKSYKFKIEATTEHPDMFQVYTLLINYRFNDNGLPRTVYIIGPDGVDGEELLLPSPFIKEFDVPRSFSSIMLSCSVEAVSSKHEPYQKDEKISFKVYVNDKLVFTHLDQYQVIVQMFYNPDLRKYIVLTKGRRVELDKL